MSKVATFSKISNEEEERRKNLAFKIDADSMETDYREFKQERQDKLLEKVF